MTDIREYLRDHVLIFDGAFGTYYSQRIDQASGSCELANVDHPDLVGEIHREYLIAGAQALKTNTFGAYASLVGGPEKQAEIIWKGLSLAEEALRDYRELDSAPGNRPVYIFADLGPAPGDTPEQKAEQYIKAAELFLQAGAKHFLFETQTVTDGLVEAARYIKKQRPDAFILVSFGVLPDGYSTAGQFYRQMILEVLESGYVDLAGLNCVSSPGHMAKLLGKLPEELLLRIAAMPNAGYPVVRGFRTFFDGSAKYFQGTMKRFLDMGIRVLGGCCGTTPDYIRGLAELAADQVVVPHDYTSPYQGEGENPDKPSSDQKEKEGQVVSIDQVSLNTTNLHTFDPLEVRISYTVYVDQVEEYSFGVAIYSEDRKLYVFGPNTYLEKADVPSTKGQHTVVYRIPKLPLIQGVFAVDVGVFSNGGLVNLDYKENIRKFVVSNPYFSEGTCYMEHEWKVIAHETDDQ